LGRWHRHLERFRCTLGYIQRGDGVSCNHSESFGRCVL
jgi:hypothetical protein